MTGDKLRTFIVTQTEQFRVRAVDAEQAKRKVAESTGEEADVELMSCTASEAEEVTADGAQG